MTPVIIGDATLFHADCIEAMRAMPDVSVDSIVTDPPYELGFMGKSWDSSGIANSVEMWREALRVLKPGGHLLAFSGSRTSHRMVCAIEDAGFEIRDSIPWIYGSGFPKSMNVSKAIDKAAGAEREVTQKGLTKLPEDAGKFTTLTSAMRERRDVPVTDAASQWEGWGTAIKPAHEPCCMARKPLIGTVAENVLTHGTGALNIDACRIVTDEVLRAGAGNIPCRNDSTVPRGRDGQESADARYSEVGGTDFAMTPGPRGGDPMGRWPANIIHDGSAEVVALFPESAGQQGDLKETGHAGPSSGRFGDMAAPHAHPARNDTGSAARFFYCPKASREDRNEGCDALPQKVGGMVSNTSGQHLTRRDEEYEAKPLGNHHPTVKPTDLMAYLCRLVTPPGGTVLDPFMGSGSTGKAAIREGFKFIGIDMTPEYVEIARARIAYEIEQVAKAAAEAKETAELAARQPDLFAPEPMKQEQQPMFAEAP